MRRMAVLFAVPSSLLTSCAALGVESVTQADTLAEIMLMGMVFIAKDADYSPQSRLLEDILL